MTFHKQGQVTVPTTQLHQATVQEQELKIILTGSGIIKAPGQCLEGIPALQQHQFCCKWHWELTIVSNLQNLKEDIENKDMVTQSAMVQSKKVMALQHGLLKGTPKITE